MSEEKVTVLGQTIPVTHVYEAARALAFFVTRLKWGFSRDETIIEIDMGYDKPANDVSTAVTQMRTYAPPFTRAMDHVPGNAVVFDDPDTVDTLTRAIINRSRAAGLDINAWALDCMLCAMAGPVAEAPYLGKDVRDFFISEQWARDRSEAALSFLYWKDIRTLSGYEQEFMHTLKFPTLVATALIERNRQAISALAVALPRKGTFPGAKASEILAAHYKEA